MLISEFRLLPDGVTVAQLILDQFVLVRIQIGQPFSFLVSYQPVYYFLFVILRNFSELN